MRVPLLAVPLSATSPIGESSGESIRQCLPAQTGCGDRQARERRHSRSVLVDCPGKAALPAIGDSGPINGLALSTAPWLDRILTVKSLIRYGSDVSASRPARLVDDKTST
jgi:hypothetical protein